jgi:tRNA A-37 threonylcarbamoyl transferase component Bud32
VVADALGATLLVESNDQDTLLERLRRVLAGELEVEGELARGGMGVVFKAREVGLGRRVALKVLAPELAVNVRAAERFKREGRTVAELDHPNIVPVYRVGQVGDVLFMAMKFIEGRGLGSIVEAQGALPVPVVIDVLRAAARALAYAHGRGIVHRDVKGDNILVDTEGQVMMTDFGVALRAADVTLTLDGSVIGTPAFMSPEQCSGERAGPQSDQYSLGVVAFQMLAGAVPFTSETITGYIQHHLLTPAPDLRTVRTDLPPELLAVVRRALAKRARDRFASTEEMLIAIEAIPFTADQQRESQDTLRRLVRGSLVGKIDATFASNPEARTMLIGAAGPSRGRRVLRLASAGAALVVLVLGGLAVAKRGRGGTPAPAPAAGPAPPAALGADAPIAGRLLAPAAALDSGTLRLFTIPPDAEILVDGRVVGVGSVFDLRVPAGRRRIRARATGYLPLDTVITVPVDGLVNLGRLPLRTGQDRL